MRVLLAHNRYRTAGGEERHTDLLDESLRAVGVEVARLDVATPRHPSRMQRATLGMTLTYRPAGARLLRNRFDTERPDVVHFHNTLPLLTPAALREARRLGARVVLTAHNYRFACPSGTLLRDGRIHEDCVEGSSLLCGLRNSRGAWSESIAYGIAIEAQRRLRLLDRWVDAFVAPSEFIARMLVRAGYSGERIHVIHHGTPIDKTLVTPGDFALYAGRLSREKGIEALLAASALAPRVPLVIAGDGPLASLVRERQSETLRYVGKVEQDEVRDLIRGARFTIAPSVCYEVQPFGVLESLAVGRPVIASHLGGLAEIVEEGITGSLVPPNDPTALAAAMGRLWDDKGLATEMGANAWAYAKENFSPIEQARCLVRLYEQLISSGSLQ